MCKLGMHKWVSRRISWGFTSRVYDVEKRCTKCDKLITTVIPKEDEVDEEGE